MPRGGIATYIGRRADLYRFTRRSILVDEATYIGSPSDQYRFIAPPSRAACRRNLAGRINLREGRHSIIAKQSSYIDRYARGRRASAPSPRPPEARLIAQEKARRLTLRAEIWSTFAEFYPSLFLRPSGGDEVAGSPFLPPQSAGHSSSKDKPTIQPHKNHDASTPHRLVP